MSANKKFCIWTHIKGIIIITLIGTSISLLFSGSSPINWSYLRSSLLYSLFIGSTLWIGNFSISPALDRIFRKYPLSPGGKLIYSLLIMMLVSCSIILLVNWCWFGSIQGIDFWKFVARGSGMSIMIIEIVVVVIIALVMYTKEFFYSWREAVTSEEELKREKLVLQYESLKNQVNPHFLFNSLNTLSGLIDKDAEKATRFVRQLSDIYRYVLEQKDRELVSLETEMQFVNNYISLMRIRFGENLVVNTDTQDEYNLKVIPLSVQMLVENAIKHNIISMDKPLIINIKTEESAYLTVENNLQKKSSVLQENTGEWEKHGLMNIKSRYEYLSHNKFEVNGSIYEPFPEEYKGNFVVKVPLIK
jgi:hypothetical protein